MLSINVSNNIFLHLHHMIKSIHHREMGFLNLKLRVELFSCFMWLLYSVVLVRWIYWKENFFLTKGKTNPPKSMWKKTPELPNTVARFKESMNQIIEDSSWKAIKYIWRDWIQHGQSEGVSQRGLVKEIQSKNRIGSQLAPTDTKEGFRKGRWINRRKMTPSKIRMFYDL